MCRCNISPARAALQSQKVHLRLLFWCAKYAPLNYPRFLDYTTERILLRKVSGGYIFVHSLLLNYFATLTIDDRSASFYYYQKGVEHYTDCDYEKAFGHFEYAIHLAPDNFNFYFKKGHVLKRLGRLEEAEQAYEKARRLRDSK